MRIVIVTTGLYAGGAETVLLELIKALMDSTNNEILIVSLLSGGELEKKFEELGVKVLSMRSKTARFSPRSSWHTWQTISAFRPQIIQGWMYHGSLFAAIFRELLRPRPGLGWSFHHSDFSPENNKRKTLWLIRLIGLLSHSLTVRIAFCGVNSMRAHEEIGFYMGNVSIVPNGVDTYRFRPEAARRSQVRAALGLDAGCFLIGCIASWHPIKDHRTLVNGAKIISEKNPNIRFLLCGRGVDSSNNELRGLLQTAGVENRFILHGMVADMPAIYNACDLVVLTSKGESFPMVLIEALGSGTPCVATDVGECGYILNRTDRIFSVGDADRFAALCLAIISMDPMVRQRMAKIDRIRVKRFFDTDSLMRGFEGLWFSILREEKKAIV